MQHLDLRHVGRGVSKPLQPHTAAFHPTQAVIAVAVGSYIMGKESPPQLSQFHAFSDFASFYLLTLAYDIDARC